MGNFLTRKPDVHVTTCTICGVTSLEGKAHLCLPAASVCWCGKPVMVDRLCPKHWDSAERRFAQTQLGEV